MQVLFPRHRSRGSRYIGGAHGTLGVLYVIIQAYLMDQEQIFAGRRDLIDLITGTCIDLLAIQDQTPDGNFPAQRLDPGVKQGKLKNHWCHGAPGAIGPLLAATEFYLRLS